MIQNTSFQIFTPEDLKKIKADSDKIKKKTEEAKYQLNKLLDSIKVKKRSLSEIEELIKIREGTAKELKTKINNLPLEEKADELRLLIENIWKKTEELKEIEDNILDMRDLIEKERIRYENIIENQEKAIENNKKLIKDTRLLISRLKSKLETLRKEKIVAEEKIQEMRKIESNLRDYSNVINSYNKRNVL